MQIQGDSLRAIQGAETSLTARSRNIANVNTPGYQALDVVVSDGSPRVRMSSPSPGGFSKRFDTPVGPLVEAPPAKPASRSSDANSTGLPNNVDLAKDLVGIQQDRRTAGYSLKSLKVQDRMTGDLLDLVG